MDLSVVRATGATRARKAAVRAPSQRVRSLMERGEWAWVIDHVCRSPNARSNKFAVT